MLLKSVVLTFTILDDNLSAKYLGKSLSSPKNATRTKTRIILTITGRVTKHLQCFTSVFQLPPSSTNTVQREVQFCWECREFRAENKFLIWLPCGRTVLTGAIHNNLSDPAFRWSLFASFDCSRWISPSVNVCHRHLKVLLSNNQSFTLLYLVRKV